MQDSQSHLMNACRGINLLWMNKIWSVQLDWVQWSLHVISAVLSRNEWTSKVTEILSSSTDVTSEPDDGGTDSVKTFLVSFHIDIANRPETLRKFVNFPLSFSFPFFLPFLSVADITSVPYRTLTPFDCFCLSIYLMTSCYLSICYPLEYWSL